MPPKCVPGTDIPEEAAIEALRRRRRLFISDPFSLTVYELLCVHQEMNAGTTTAAIREADDNPLVFFALATGEEAVAFSDFAKARHDENCALEEGPTATVEIQIGDTHGSD